MSLGRSIGLALLGMLLTLTLSAGIVVTASHQTVLDPDFVSTSLDEAGVYDLVADTLVEGMANATEPEAGSGAAEGGAAGVGNGSGSIADVIDFGPSVARDVVDAGYIEDQTEANIDRLYAYLHGNGDEPAIYVESAPLKDDAVAAIETRIENAPISVLLGSVAGGTGDLPAGQTAILDPAVVASMADNESSYEAAQAAVRSNAREYVVEQSVDRTYDRRSADQKLALVIPDYDPFEYTDAEKAGMVEEREAEIRTAIREEIERERGDEIERAVDGQLDSLAEATTEPEDPDANVTAAGMAFQAAVVDGLAGQLTYPEFRAETDRARSALATAVSTEAEAAFDREIPDRVSLTDEFGSADDYRQARRVVGYLDAAMIAIPALAIVLIGLVHLVSRSMVTTVRTTGSSFLFAGLPTYVTTAWAEGNLESLLPPVPEGADMVTDVVVTVVGRVLGVIAADALAMTVAGLALLGLSLALSRGLLDGVLDRTG